MKKLLIGLLAGASLTMAGCSTGGEQNQANVAGNEASANAAAPKAPLPDADPAMWVVRDADTIIYLFGTFHLLDGKTDWFNDEVRQAFDQSQELVFEIDMPKDPAKMGEMMGPLVLRYAVDPQGRKLSSRLSPEQNKKLAAALASIGAPAAAFDRFEPWFVNMSLSAVAARKLGLTGANGAEEVLRRAAEARKMTMGAVETIEGQIQLFDNMSEETQLAQLKSTLDEMDKVDETMPRMLQVWNAGDAEGLEQVMNEGLKEHPEVRRALLENRNRAWAEWIAQRLARPGTVFMAVGAGHLVGPDSVQTFLKQRNIEAERVPQQTPGR